MKCRVAMDCIQKQSTSRRTIIRFLGLLPIATWSLLAQGKEGSKKEKRGEVRKMASSVLRRLYRMQPGSRQAIAGSVGYAVFSNFGLKIFFAGGGSGKGLVVDNTNKQETFMKMFELQAGIGIGIKKFSVVFVFETHDALTNFIDSGWEFSAQGTAAAIRDNQGKSYQGAISVAPDVWLYQLTDKGLALELSAKGSKYYRDDDLN